MVVMRCWQRRDNHEFMWYPDGVQPNDPHRILQRAPTMDYGRPETADTTPRMLSLSDEKVPPHPSLWDRLFRRAA